MLDDQQLERECGKNNGGHSIYNALCPLRMLYLLTECSGQ